MIDNLMPDIPRIYTAVAEWMACMLFIVSLKKRFEWWKSGLIMAGMLVLQSVFLVATGNVPIYFWIPCMIAAVSLMVGFIYFCCDVNFQDAGYFGMIAFVVAEFMASLEWQIVCTVWTNELPGKATKSIMLAAVYGAVFFLLWKLLQQHLPKDGKLNISFKEYFSAAVIVIAVFAVSNLSFVSNADTFANGYALEIGQVRTIVDLGGIAVLYAHLIQYLSPDTFVFSQSITFVTVLVLGGRDCLMGPILGAILLTGINTALLPLGQYKSLVYGVILLLTLFFIPKGVVETVGSLIRKLTRGKNHAES